MTSAALSRLTNTDITHVSIRFSNLKEWSISEIQNTVPMHSYGAVIHSEPVMHKAFGTVSGCLSGRPCAGRVFWCVMQVEPGSVWSETSGDAGEH